MDGRNINIFIKLIELSHISPYIKLRLDLDQFTRGHWIYLSHVEDQQVKRAAEIN